MTTDVGKASGVVWQRADVPAGVIVPLPGYRLAFDSGGRLVAYQEGGALPSPLRLRRIESDPESCELRLVFGPDTPKAAGGLANVP